MQFGHLEGVPQPGSLGDLLTIINYFPSPGMILQAPSIGLFINHKRTFLQSLDIFVWHWRVVQYF